MPLQIRRGNIVRIKADAIVNPTDQYYSGSGGTDYAIHKEAGPELDRECSVLAMLETGSVHVTDSYDMMNCRYIIHTVGPVYIDGESHENEKLAACYRNSLLEAKKLNLSSIAFPLISSGTFGFPKGQALKVATDTITEFLLDNDLDVILLVYSKDAFDTAKKLFVDIQDYLREEPGNSDICELNDTFKERRLFSLVRADKSSVRKNEVVEFYQSRIEPMGDICGVLPKFEPDESFSDNVRRLLKEKNLEDPDVYKKCNMDKKLFNHIKNRSDYRPKKETAVAIAIGFRLNMKETEELLSKAGYVLSDSFVFDKIIRYCIENKTYNIFDINEILFQYDQKTLGC